MFFLEFSCFFYDLMDVHNLISGSSAFSKSNFYIWKFSVHVPLKPSFKHFEHDPASVWNEHNGTAVWIFFLIVFLWDWNENWHFPSPVLWPLLSFPNLLAYLAVASFMIWNSLTRIPSPPLALFIVMLPKAHLTSYSIQNLKENFFPKVRVDVGITEPCFDCLCH